MYRAILCCNILPCGNALTVLGKQFWYSIGALAIKGITNWLLIYRCVQLNCPQAVVYIWQQSPVQILYRKRQDFILEHSKHVTLRPRKAFCETKRKESEANVCDYVFCNVNTSSEYIYYNVRSNLRKLLDMTFYIISWTLLLSFISVKSFTFTYIIQVYFTATETIIRLSQCQQKNPECCLFPGSIKSNKNVSINQTVHITKLPWDLKKINGTTYCRIRLD